MFMCVSLKPTSSDLCTISCVWVSLKDVGVTSDVRYLSLSLSLSRARFYLLIGGACRGGGSLWLL